MKRKTRVWLVAIAILLLLATTYEVLAIYYPPGSRQMMLAGHLRIDPQPKPEQTDVTLLVAAAYTAGVALLLFALFFRRPRLEDAPPTI